MTTREALERAAVKDYLSGSEVDPAVVVAPELLAVRSTIHKGRRFIVLRLDDLAHVLAVYGVEGGELKRLGQWPEAVEVKARIAEASAS